MDMDVKDCGASIERGELVELIGSAAVDALDERICGWDGGMQPVGNVVAGRLQEALLKFVEKVVDNYCKDQNTYGIEAMTDAAEVLAGMIVKQDAAERLDGILGILGGCSDE